LVHTEKELEKILRAQEEENTALRLQPMVQLALSWL